MLSNQGIDRTTGYSETGSTTSIGPSNAVVSSMHSDFYTRRNLITAGLGTAEMATGSTTSSSRRATRSKLSAANTYTPHGSSASRTTPSSLPRFISTRLSRDTSSENGFVVRTHSVIDRGDEGGETMNRPRPSALEFDTPPSTEEN